MEKMNEWSLPDDIRNLPSGGNGGSVLGCGTNSSIELIVWSNLLYGSNLLCRTCDYSWASNYLYGIAPPCVPGPDHLAWKSTGLTAT